MKEPFLCEPCPVATLPNTSSSCTAVRRELTEKILVTQLALFPALCGTEWLVIAIIGSYLEPNEYRPRLRKLLSDNYFNNIKKDKR